MDTVVKHAIGRPADGIIAVCFEKCNSTEVADLMFRRLGLAERAKRYHRFPHTYRWNEYTRQFSPPAVRDLLEAKKNGCIVLKFRRCPVARFCSIWKKYNQPDSGLRDVPPGLTLDDFIQRVATMKLRRYRDDCDPHLATQRFYNERTAMWTEVIDVETLHEPETVERLRREYGLRVDTTYAARHWVGGDVDLTGDQIVKIKAIYRGD